MALNERDILNNLIYELRDGLLPFVVRELKARYGTERAQQVLQGEARHRRDWSIDREVDSQDTLDTYVLLKMIRVHWDGVFMHSVREPDRYFFRSCASILEEARHLTAHQGSFDAEDVIFFILTAERLFNLIPSRPESRASLRAMKRDLLGVAYRDVLAELYPPPAQEPEKPPEVHVAMFDESIQAQLQEILDLLRNRDHQSTQAAQDEQEEAFEVTDEPEEVDYFNVEVSVEPGPHANTLTISDGTYSLTKGKSKLELISDFEDVIREFALTGEADEDQLDVNYGYPILCLPDVNERKIGFGRAKARMLIAAMPYIDDWLGREVIYEDD